jgi:hypothetical protein
VRVFGGFDVRAVVLERISGRFSADCNKGVTVLKEVHNKFWSVP